MNIPELNFTKCACEGSLDIVVVPVVFNSFSFPHSGCRNMAQSEFSLQKWTFWAPKILGDQFSWDATISEQSTRKTSVGENLVKICCTVAEQSYQKKNNKKTQNAY